MLTPTWHVERCGDQWAAYLAALPEGENPVPLDQHFDTEAGATAYARSRERLAAVDVPSGVSGCAGVGEGAVGARVGSGEWTETDLGPMVAAINKMHADLAAVGFDFGADATTEGDRL